MSRTGWMLLALACIAAPARGDVFVSDEVLSEPTPRAFSVCFGHTCGQVAQLGLQPGQWARVRAHLEPVPDSAVAERLALAGAVAEMERIVGPLTGTEGDRGRNDGTRSRYGMDCIDESTNTTSYLRILAGAGLLRFHAVADRVTRGWFLRGMPHTTAVLVELDSGREWAVDSWFHDNGEPPELLPLEQWRSGWEPPEEEEEAHAFMP